MGSCFSKDAERNGSGSSGPRPTQAAVPVTGGTAGVPVASVPSGYAQGYQPPEPLHNDHHTHDTKPLVYQNREKGSSAA